MIFADIDSTGIATWAGVLVTVLGATIGSFMAVRIGLVTLGGKVDAIATELAKVASGDTGIMGIVRTKIEQHDGEIREIFGRLHKVENEHAANHPRCPDLKP